MEPCKIKICGLSRFSDILAANEAAPDYIGFVFARSSRQVTADKAGQLKRELDSKIQAVGVFVNAPMEEILGLTGDAPGRERTVDLIQLHGDEDESYIRNLKKHTELPIIKAVRMENAVQVMKAQELPCDYLLLDTLTKGAYGGAGITFDWSMIPRLSKPYFLAGGINRENIIQAAAHNPYCIDVSSGAETDGRKDRKKMTDLVSCMRNSSDYRESKGA